MPFEPEHLESEQSISAGEDAVETPVEREFSEDTEAHEDGIAAEGHTIKVGGVG
jgi:hypothetical protein